MVAVNVSIWNLTSDCEEWSASIDFDRSGESSAKRAAKALRVLAREIAKLELDADE